LHSRAQNSSLRQQLLTAICESKCPDIPTLSDFVPGYEANTWWGVGAPRNTPFEIIDMLNKEINAALADPKLNALVGRLR
jgi:tripartite-type tricarboxylate transporter receptor subunit TctC